MTKTDKRPVTEPLPKSKAKTAYGLLSEVRRLILKQPLRYCQARYIARVGSNGRDVDQIGPTHSVMYAPPCGTVGCVAGWIATLARGNNFNYGETGPIAEQVLGLDFEATLELFKGGAVKGPAQTPEHATNGAAHIAAFQKKYSKELRAKQLVRGRDGIR